VLLLALLHAVNEIVELKCLVVVDTHDLIASGLKNFANSGQRSLNFYVEIEFGAVMLAASLHFPNLEFGAVETCGHNKANAGVTFSTLSSQQVARLFEFNNGRKTRLGVGMGLKVFGNLVLLNIPHLNFSFLSSNTEEIFVNLEQTSGTLVVFVGFLESSLAGLEFNFADDRKTLSPIRHAHHSARAQLETLPLELNHSVELRGFRAAN